MAAGRLPWGMSTVEMGVLLPEAAEMDDAEFAASAESLGYESIWVGENWGENAFVRLATVAERTAEIRLGTAITNVYSRSPAVIAMTAADIDERSAGRFTLGVGPSSPTLVEGLHGMAFDRPVRRTHETVELVRAFTSDEDTVSYDGELFEVDGFPALDRSFPIYNAAIGSANRRATGRLCDGWLPHLIPFSELPDAFETVTNAAESAGRDPEEISIAPYLPAAVSDDAESARTAVAKHVAFYVGSSPSFRSAVGRAFPDRADRIATRWNDGERGEAVAAIDETMLEELAVFGTPTTARGRLRDLLDRELFDVPLLALPAGVDRAMVERTVEALAPSEL